MELRALERQRPQLSLEKTVASAIETLHGW